MDSPVVAEFLGHLVRASWQASILAGVVWLVIRLLGDQLDAGWRCRLWMLVIVRLAWPVSLPSSVSVFNLFEVPWIMDRGEPDPGTGEPGLLPLLRFLEMPAVQWVWVAVAGVLGLRMLGAAAWTWWVQRTARPLDSWDTWWLLQNCKAAADCRIPVSVLESRRVQAPCVLGLVRPRLILPCGLAGELDREELRLVFLHELAHLSRRDLAMNWLLAAVETIHWFNPIAWHITRQLRADREEDCDARALESEPGSGRRYGEVILKLLDRVGAPADPVSPEMSTPMLGDEEADIQPLLHRIHAIRRFRPGARTRVVGFCSWLAVALVGLTDPEPAHRWNSEDGDQASGPLLAAGHRASAVPMNALHRGWPL
ncbi:MAG: M56 family metallopeptidase [Verrucomicrobiae bacterium]|nr:M56 family metallopeptidase [Verrucomicrobiae bacterium]